MRRARGSSGGKGQAGGDGEKTDLWEAEKVRSVGPGLTAAGGQCIHR